MHKIKYKILNVISIIVIVIQERFVVIKFKKK